MDKVLLDKVNGIREDSKVKKTDGWRSKWRICAREALRRASGLQEGRTE